MSNPHGEAATDPSRVRVAVRPPHFRQIATVAGRHFRRQTLNHSYGCGIAMPIERVNV
ncbi:MAG: hypothetical protein R2722_02805 [Tessaracoccus sp.]